MRIRITFAATAVAAATALAAGPATAQAASINSLAKADCKIERQTDRAEFIAKYGGTGKAALNRCVRDEKREAKRDCKEDRIEDPREFEIEFGGTDNKALKNCVASELR